MKIREIRASRGPNYWSIRRPYLIVMTLDLEEMEAQPSDEVEGFGLRLEAMFPSMYSHRCSPGIPGGFFKRVKKGTWMGHIIEHIALEIQTLAGMEVGFGRTRGYGETGVYNVVFDYKVESVGRYAAKAAVAICQALIDGTENKYNLEGDIQEMRELRERDRLGPSTQSIVDEAYERGIPYLRLNDHSLCQLGYGAKQKRIQATLTSETSSIGVDLASDKEETKYLLKEAAIPVPKGEIITEENQVQGACDYIGYPLVIKPIDGHHGQGITVNICNYRRALTAFKEAQEISTRVVIEKFIVGSDYRLLIINNRMIAAAKRTPAHVIGNGRSTIKELVDLVNQDPRRGYGHEKVLTQIEINSLTRSIINEAGYRVDSVLPEGETLILKDTANLSTGGTADDVTDFVHPTNVSLAERISKIIDLDICGIDIMTTDISKPLEETAGTIIEVNAGPGFRMHLAPSVGLPRNVAAPVVDKLFPEKSNTGRIPIIAITGTNGKTTTARLIAHMAKMKGFQVGYTTTDGVYVQNRLLVKGDCTGPQSAEFVLKDPTVNFAVLECARGGILRSGLAFERCDVGIVTNVTGDHLGLKGIQTFDQLARLKRVVPDTVSQDGYAILNADDDVVFEMGEDLHCNIALFSMDADNPRIKTMQKAGGITAVYENGYISLYRGIWQMRIMKAHDIPLTFEGKAPFMIQNILPAVITANIKGISIEDMKAALTTFIPSEIQTPGRMNFFEFDHFKVLLDYAHNPAGLKALQKFTDALEASFKVGIIAGVGDRRAEDIKNIGAISAEMFDEIIIRFDLDLRGKTQEEILKLLEEGIRSKKPHIKTKIIPKEKEALSYAIENAHKDSLIVHCVEEIEDSIKLLKQYKMKNSV